MSMLKILAVFLAVFMCATVLKAGEFDLKEGERLEYAARFLYVIPLGDVYTQVNDTVGYGSQATFLINCEAKTAKWLFLLFKAEAVLNSYVAKATLYPYKFEQVLKVVGKQDDIRRATYDRATNSMAAEGKGRKKVPADVRDPVSALYYLRTLELKKGMEIRQMVNNNQSTYIFNSTVTGRKKLGKFSCWELNSKIRRENKSMYHSMDATIYISDDAGRVPVQINAKTKLGPVTLRLKEKIRTE